MNKIKPLPAKKVIKALEKIGSRRGYWKRND